mgnify:CR=1 FL=1
MKKQKYVFQLVDHKTGYRSEAFVGTYDELRKTMEENEEKTNEDDYILLVAVIDPEKDGMTIPKSPLITIKTFIELKRPPQQVAEQATKIAETLGN